MCTFGCTEVGLGYSADESSRRGAAGLATSVVASVPGTGNRSRIWVILHPHHCILRPITPTRLRTPTEPALEEGDAAGSACTGATSSACSTSVVRVCLSASQRIERHQQGLRHAKGNDPAHAASRRAMADAETPTTSGTLTADGEIAILASLA